MAFRLFCLMVLWTCTGSMAYSQKPAVPARYRTLIPQQLLPLVHSPEVQSELELTSQQVDQLEAFFMQVDGDWFRSRNLRPEERSKEMDRLEGEFWRWANNSWDASKIERLKQLELQALGSRMFLRADVAEQLALTPAQIGRMLDLAKVTQAAQTKLQEAAAKGETTSQLEKSYSNALRAEQEEQGLMLTMNQSRQLVTLVGPVFDTSWLERIYPMAPEFDSNTQWINSPPLTLDSLRGQVVVVHFYAFQCHNCHANFEIYRRWHEKYRDKGVTIIGIQSPETQRERNLDAVRKAAIDNQLEFPIIMDSEMKNWKNWANTMWPTVYVVDKRGYLRHWWQGELQWQGADGDQVLEQVIEKALAE